MGVAAPRGSSLYQCLTVYQFLPVRHLHAWYGGFLSFGETKETYLVSPSPLQPADATQRCLASRPLPILGEHDAAQAGPDARILSWGVRCATWGSHDRFSRSDYCVLSGHSGQCRVKLGDLAVDTRLISCNICEAHQGPIGCWSRALGQRVHLRKWCRRISCHCSCPSQRDLERRLAI